MKLRELWYHHCHQRHEIHNEVCQVVVGIVGAQQKQHDRYRQQKFLGRRVLISIVDLLPHVQIVICSSIELEGYASDVMKHEVGAGHVGDVGQSPRDLLCYAGDDVEEDLEADNENRVYSPGTCVAISMCTCSVAYGRTF